MCFANVGIVNAVEPNDKNISSEENIKSEFENDDVVSGEEKEGDSINENDSDEFINEQTDESEDSLENANGESTNESIPSTGSDENLEQETSEFENESSEDEQNDSPIYTGIGTRGMRWEIYGSGLMKIGGGSWSRLETNWSDHSSMINEIEITEEITPNPTDGFSSMFSGLNHLKSISGLELLLTKDAVSFDSMFKGCKELESIDLSSFNTVNATNMRSMFSQCSALTSLDLSTFTTDNVLYFQDMFSLSGSLKTLRITNFNTSSAVSMNSMFDYCQNLEFVDLSFFDTSNVTDMGFMFNYCVSLKQLDLSNFNTAKVRRMNYMFSNTWNLETINLSSFNVENVTDFRYLLSDSRSLKYLDLTNFMNSKVLDSTAAFSNMNKLEKLLIPNWVNSSKDQDIFKGSPITEIRVGDKFKFNILMRLRELPIDHVWVNEEKEEFSTNQLIDYHGQNKESTYHVEQQYTLTFNTMGGTNISEQKKIGGKLWDIPEYPEKNGLIFDYWSYDIDGEERYDFSTVIEESLTLYANYKAAYIITIPEKWNLNEEKVIKVSAENYLEDKELSIVIDSEISLRNISDENIVIKKHLNFENKSSPNTILEVNGIGTQENKIVVESSSEAEPAGKYEGVISFKTYYK